MRLGLVAVKVNVNLVDFLLQGELFDLWPVLLGQSNGVAHRHGYGFDIERLDRLELRIPQIIVRPADSERFEQILRLGHGIHRPKNILTARFELRRG